MTTPQTTSRKRGKNKEPTIKVVVPPDVALKLEAAPNIEITAEQREGERRAAENERRQQDAMAFAVQSLMTPAPTDAPAEAPKTPQAAIDEYQAKLAELNKAYGIQPSQHPTKAMRNGITRPSPGTVTGKVWAAADAITIAQNRSATIAELKMHPDLRSVNDNTIKTQYARWRQYNGVQGRIDTTVKQKVMDHDGNP